MAIKNYSFLHGIRWYLLMNKKLKVLFFTIGLLFVKNLIMPNSFAVDVICRSESGIYYIVRHDLGPQTIWAKEETMYRNGVKAILYLNLNFIKDGKKSQFIYDRLLAFYPYDIRSSCTTIEMVENLANFILESITTCPIMAFKVDSINIFSASRSGTEYLDLIDVIASPIEGVMPPMPSLFIKPRHTSPRIST